MRSQSWHAASDKTTNRPSMRRQNWHATCDATTNRPSTRRQNWHATCDATTNRPSPNAAGTPLVAKLPLATGPLKLVMPAEDDPAPTSLQSIGELRCNASPAHPDIHTAIRIVGKFSAKHTAEHFRLPKDIMLYPEDTMDVQLIITICLLGPDGHIRVELFTDAARNLCSISGWVVAVNDQPVLWHRECQSLVTLSSTHAEVVACSDGIKDSIYTCDIISEFHKMQYPVIVHQDNMATIQMFSDPINNGTTKYTAVKHFWTHEFIDDGTVKLQHISGAAMLSVDDVKEYVAEIEPSPYGIKQSTRKLHESSGIQDRTHAKIDPTGRASRDRELAAATP